MGDTWVAESIRLQRRNLGTILAKICAVAPLSGEWGERREVFRKQEGKTVKASKPVRASELGVARSRQHCSADMACLLRKVFHTEAKPSTGPQRINYRNQSDITHLLENLSLSALRF